MQVNSAGNRVITNIAKQADKTTKEIAKTTEVAVNSVIAKTSGNNAQKNSSKALSAQEALNYLSTVGQRPNGSQIKTRTTEQVANLYKSTANSAKNDDTLSKNLGKISDKIDNAIDKANLHNVRSAIVNNIKQLRNYAQQQGTADFAKDNKTSVRQILKDGLKDLKETLKKDKEPKNPNNDFEQDIQKHHKNIENNIKEKINHIKENHNKKNTNNGEHNGQEGNQPTVHPSKPNNSHINPHENEKHTHEHKDNGNNKPHVNPANPHGSHDNSHNGDINHGGHGEHCGHEGDNPPVNPTNPTNPTTPTKPSNPPHPTTPGGHNNGNSHGNSSNGDAYHGFNNHFGKLCDKLGTFLKSHRFHQQHQESPLFDIGTKLNSYLLIKLKTNAELLNQVFGVDTSENLQMINGLIKNQVERGVKIQVNKELKSIYGRLQTDSPKGFDQKY